MGQNRAFLPKDLQERGLPEKKKKREEKGNPQGRGELSRIGGKKKDLNGAERVARILGGGGMVTGSLTLSVVVLGGDYPLEK